jgi:tRNA threonylcarbamoyladenosine biosynthesis protein TsaE
LETGLKLSVPSLNELPGAARELIAFAEEKGRRIWLFEGNMGAGKTTLIKEVCRQLQVEDTVQSPTFSIVNEYRTQKGQPVYHFDFYRINEVEEAVHIGVEDYFYSGDWCFIEWPSKVESILPDEYLLVEIKVESVDNCREILLSVYG